MKEFVLKGGLTLERVTFRVSAKTLEGALARADNGDFDNYDAAAAAAGARASAASGAAAVLCVVDASSHRSTALQELKVR